MLKLIYASGMTAFAVVLAKLPSLSMEREHHVERFFYELIALVSIAAFMGAGTECVIKRRKDPNEKIGTAINVWAAYIAASVILGFCVMSISAQALEPYYHGAERLKVGNTILGAIVLSAIGGIALSTWIRTHNARTAQEKFNKKWYLHPETGEYHRVLDRHGDSVYYDKRTYEQRLEEAKGRRYMRKMSGLAFFAAFGAALVFFLLTKAFWGVWPAYLFVVCGIGGVYWAGGFLEVFNKHGEPIDGSGEVGPRPLQPPNRRREVEEQKVFGVGGFASPEEAIAAARAGPRAGHSLDHQEFDD